MGRQGPFDLPQFNPEAPDLYLVIDPTEILEGAVGSAPRQVAGAIEPPSREKAEEIRDEARSGKIGPIEITLGQSGTADVKFARQPPAGTSRPPASATTRRRSGMGSPIGLPRPRGHRPDTAAGTSHGRWFR